MIRVILSKFIICDFAKGVIPACFSAIFIGGSVQRFSGGKRESPPEIAADSSEAPAADKDSGFRLSLWSAGMTEEEITTCGFLEYRYANFFLGGHRRGVPPVPIPNTEVKPSTGDGTNGVVRWESSKPPGLFYLAAVLSLSKGKPPGLFLFRYRFSWGQD